MSENERIIRMRKFTRQELLHNDVPWMRPGEDFNGFRIIERKMISQSRWSLDFQTVFSFEDHFYKLCFQTEATEMQECDVFYDSEPDCVEVFPKEVTITKYFTQSELDKS